MVISVLRFSTVVATAILAGVSLGIWIGFSPTGLSQWAYLEQQQNMLASLQGVMITLVIVSTIITFMAAYVQRQNKPVRRLLIIAALFLISCMIITRFGNFPIDTMVMSWTQDTMPGNWKEMRDRWLSFHRMRTLVEAIAFMLVTWVAIKKD